MSAPRLTASVALRKWRSNGFSLRSEKNGSMSAMRSIFVGVGVSSAGNVSMAGVFSLFLSLFLSIVSCGVDDVKVETKYISDGVLRMELPICLVRKISEDYPREDH